jgi:hypothetical protein
VTFVDYPYAATSVDYTATHLSIIQILVILDEAAIFVDCGSTFVYYDTAFVENS